MNNQKRLLIFLILISTFTISSCKLFLSKPKDKEVYMWNNKVVSKRKSDRLLAKYTHDFVKKIKKEDLELFQNLIIEYDTIPKIKTE